MLKLSKQEVSSMVGVIEYILENENKVSVDQLMKDNNLTFEEYRLMSALAMPAIRVKNVLASVKAKGAAYKGLYLHEKAEREKIEEVLMMAKDYLDRKFAPTPKVVIKSAEQEAEENGDSDDIA